MHQFTDPDPRIPASTELDLTRQLDERSRESGRTTQMLINALERAINDQATVIVIARTEEHGQRLKERAAELAPGRDIGTLLEFKTSNDIIHAVAKYVFRDHAAY